tara:strand:+ start:150 stop:395 length:246 start_codon:yes stop_codon:yes gene_type:complete
MKKKEKKMNKILLIVVLIFSFNSSVSAEEKKCRTFDIACKTKNFVNETKEFQKKKVGDGVSQLKKIPENLKQKNNQLKQRK